MPELPEVENVRRQLDAALVGATVTAVTTDGSERYRDAQAAEGAAVTAVARRGKYLLVGLDDGRELVVHLGMTGQLHWQRTPRDHCRATLVTDRGVLHIRDPRGFGSATVVTAGDRSSHPTLAALGPEPLEDGFDVAVAATALARGGGPVKARLLAQRAVAGVGNYLADEGCWRAGVHPGETVLEHGRARRLVESIVAVMQESLAAGGVSERDFEHLDGSEGSYATRLDCYGRAGHPCRRCATTLVHGRVAGRGTTWCPLCQAGPDRQAGTR